MVNHDHPAEKKPVLAADKKPAARTASAQPINTAWAKEALVQNGYAPAIAEALSAPFARALGAVFLKTLTPQRVHREAMKAFAKIQASMKS
jgi:hypothetical protein